MNGIIQYVMSECASGLFSFTMMLLRFIQVVACINILPLFIVDGFIAVSYHS